MIHKSLHIKGGVRRSDKDDKPLNCVMHVYNNIIIYIKKIAKFLPLKLENYKT